MIVEEVPDAYPDPIVTDDPAVLAYAAARSARPMVTVTDTETDQVDLRPKDHTPAVAANTGWWWCGQKRQDFF